MIPCKPFGPPARRNKTAQELLPTWQIFAVLGAVAGVLLLAMMLGTMTR